MSNEKYRTKAYSHYPPWCNRCFSIKKLSVHHKDGNRKNNNIKNLEILCDDCVREIHGFGEPRKSRQQKGNPKFMKGTRRRKC